MVYSTKPITARRLAPMMRKVWPPNRLMPSGETACTWSAWATSTTDPQQSPWWQQCPRPSGRTG
eukprot:14562860-Heterocapsa_arctica.AAC.1